MAACGAATDNVFILKHIHKAGLDGELDSVVVNNVFWMSVVQWQATGRVLVLHPIR